MPEVSVEINGRRYRMACEPGQEDHLLGLAERFNGFIEGFKGTFGEIGDGRLTVMAGIAILDELKESERQVVELTARLAAAEAEAREAGSRVAGHLVAAAERLEAVADAISDVVSGTGDGKSP